MRSEIIAMVQVDTGEQLIGAVLSINFKVSVIFNYLKGYDSHLIFKELSKLNVKISVIPNGLEKYMDLL